MSGAVSYELFTEKTGGSSSGFTAEGGIFETFVNNTGVSVKGTIVVASTTVDHAVDIAPADSQMPIGAIYESGIANGSLIKVVVSGKAEVLLKNDTASATGFWCGASDTAGRMYQASAPPGTVEENNRQIGHSLSTGSGGTDVLSMVELHFH